MRIFWELREFYKKEATMYLLGIGSLIIVALLQLVPPKLAGDFIDYVSEGTLTPKILITLVVVIGVVAVLLYGLRFVWRVTIYGASMRLGKSLRQQLFTHYTNMATVFYQKKRTGDLMALATNDIRAVQQTAGMGVLTLVDSLTTGGFVIIAMAFTISWKLTLIALIPIPIIAIFTNILGKKLHKSFREAQAAFSNLNDKTEESVTGIKVIKTFGYQKEDVEDFQQKVVETVDVNMKVAKVDALYDPIINFCIGIAFILSVGFGSMFIVNGEMTIGQLVSFTTYLGLLIWPMLAIGMLFNIIERGHASYNRIMEVLNIEPQIKESAKALTIIPNTSIEFEINEFIYDKEIALKDIYLSLQQGETLGVVGKTGAGKSTLMRLLLREFDVTKGQIRLGGNKLEDYKIETLREALGYVPQDAFLFSTTIQENIAFANMDATEEEILHAAHLACVKEDIEKLPEGLQTLVGQKGVSLSGGQKQRISIARALLLNPEILLLDDSLSAVDAKTEKTIVQNLKDNRQGKTTIITSHRLSAIEHADKIIVLSEGKIDQLGTHQQLVQEDGWYKKTYESQQLENALEGGRLVE